MLLVPFITYDMITSFSLSSKQALRSGTLSFIVFSDPQISAILNWFAKNRIYWKSYWCWWFILKYSLTLFHVSRFQIFKLELFCWIRGTGKIQPFLSFKTRIFYKLIHCALPIHEHCTTLLYKLSTLK